MAHFKPIIIRVCKKIFETSCEEITKENDGICIGQKSLPASSCLLSIREEIIQVLKKLYTFMQSDEDKYEIFKVLTLAMRPPAYSYSEEFFLIILKNCKDIIDFFLSDESDLTYDILLLMEEIFFSIYRMVKDVNKKTQKNLEIAIQSILLKSNILKYRKKINSDSSFVIYKTLIGCKSVFYPEWKKEFIFFEEKVYYRTAELDKFVAKINKKNLTYWCDLIIKCSKNKSRDKMVFKYVHEFIYKFGKSKPELAYQLLIKNNVDLENHLEYLLEGLLESNLKAETMKLINAWVVEGKYLEPILWVYRKLNNLSQNSLLLIMNLAILTKDFFVLKLLVSCVVEKIDGKSKKFIKKVILPSIYFLNENHDASWIDSGLLNPSKIDDLFQFFDSDDIDVILEGCIFIPSIEYSFELLLLPIARAYPQKIINFFGKRLAYVSNDKTQYNPFPFPMPLNFKLVREPLSKYAGLIVNAAALWYKKNKKIKKHKVIEFIQLIFPSFDQPLQDELHVLLKADLKLNLPFVLSILGNYKGEFFIYDICKKIVQALPRNDKILNKVQSTMLGDSGIITTTGFFGLTNFYKSKKNQIESWLDDPNLKIRKFANDLLKKVENNIRAEKRRAERDIARCYRE